MKGAFVRLTMALAVVAAFSIHSLPIEAQSNELGGLKLPLRITAWAVSMANVATGANQMIEIRIEKWSTEQEREMLISTFLEKKQDGLLRALQKAPVKGRIRMPNRTGPDPNQTRLGWNLRYAAYAPGEDGGHQIMVATDRYMSFAEVRNQPRTVDYPFTFAQLRLNKDGEGEGKMPVAVQLQFDKKKNQVIVENYSTEPVRLYQVKIDK
jgi:hypothetical protein